VRGLLECVVATPDVVQRSYAQRRSVDAEPLELVAQRAEGDAQRGRGPGLVVEVFLQRLLDGGALDLLDEEGRALLEVSRSSTCAVALLAPNSG
jgi:hypothetical protein